MKNITIETYKKVYQKVYKNEPKPPEKEIKHFIKEYEQSLGEHFIFNFILFQFEYYEDQETQLKRIQPSWIFGKKAIERWRSKRDDWSYFVEVFRKKYNIKNIQEKKETIKIDFDKYRERNKNTLSGFLSCQLKSLFNKNNYICITCNYYKDCKS